MNNLPGVYELAPKIAAVVALSILTIWFGRLASIPLRSGPMRIVRLELAFTVRSADAFMDAWKTARPCKWQQLLNEAQGWDTWFICSYAPLCALLCWMAAGGVAQRYATLAAIGHTLAGAQLLAGALDFLENAGMQRTIDAGAAIAPWPTIGGTASATKWLLLLCFLLYLISVAVVWMIGKANVSEP